MPTRNSASAQTTDETTSFQRRDQQQQQQQVASDVVAIKEGADLDLSCPIVVPSDDMIISWTCDNEPANIRSSRIHVTDMGKLRIRSAKLGDSCNYRCEAADGFGTLSVIIKVIIVDKKLIDKLNHRHNKTLSSSSQRQVGTKASSANQQPESIATTNLTQDHQNDSTPSKRTHKATSLGTQTNAHSGTQLEPTLDVQIEPSVLRIQKNRTFSLECRVRHQSSDTSSQHARQQPQIIWLKELIGSKPDSLSEAHERNLISIDNVYYHSLNWPRSITHSNGSSTTSSALLIRHSNLIHSGKYMCFAGYPPYLMSPRLRLGFEAGHEQNREKLPLAPRYKIATAEVRVTNDEGPEEEEEAGVGLKSGDQATSLTPSGGSYTRRTQKYLLVSMVSTNNWKRNLIIIMTVFCAVLYVAKIFHVKYTTNRDSKSAGEVVHRVVDKNSSCHDNNSNWIDTTTQTSRLVGQQSTIDVDSSTTVAAKQLLQLSSVVEKLQHSRPINNSPLRGVKSNSVPNMLLSIQPSTKSDLQSKNNLHRLKQSQPLARIPSAKSDIRSSDDHMNDEHPYSEISDRFMMANNSEQGYYKVPIRRDKAVNLC